MSCVTIALVDCLVERFEALRPLLREHVADNFGEVLPHLFFGDLTRYVVTRQIDAEKASGELAAELEREVAALLDELERVYVEGVDELEELIAVSFLENLPRDGEPGDAIRRQLGPHLKEQLHRIG
jgi:hypothetical protein